MKPLISVIIPVYNGDRYLAEAIDSALAQDYRPLEVIVADDGSTDASAAVASSVSEVTLLQLDHAGVSVARNSAVAVSKGEWLAFLDSDDIWLPGKLAAQIVVSEDNPAAGIIFAERIHRFETVPSWFGLPVDDEPQTCFEPSAWLVRRGVFDLVGGFEAGRALGEDMNWLVRAWSMGVAYAVARQPLVFRRIHETNASSALPTVKLQVMSLLRESLAIKKALQLDRETAESEARESIGKEDQP